MIIPTVRTTNGYDRIMKWILTIGRTIEESLGLSIDNQNRLLLSIFVLLVLMIFRVTLRRLSYMRIEDSARRYQLNKAISYTVGFISFALLLAIWIGGKTGLLAYFGLLSAGLAIALQAPLSNLAGWLFITLRKPFVVGDRIQIDKDTAGDVIDVRLFSFSVIEVGNWVAADQSTGRIVHIPNAVVFKSYVANYTQGFNFVWNELPVTVTFESDWRRAKRILTEICEKHTAIKSEAAKKQVKRTAHRYLIVFEHLTPIVWTSVVDIGVTLTIRYLSDPRKRRSSAEKIWEDILDSFAREENIDFAYPTMRYYHNREEGKLPYRPAPEQGGEPE